jgi:hypothetical protein
MIADGRLRAIRVGKRKLLVDADSWREYCALQRAEGVPEYTATEKAVKAHKANAEARAKAKAIAGVDLVELGLLR